MRKQQASAVFHFSLLAVEPHARQQAPLVQCTGGQQIKTEANCCSLRQPHVRCTAAVPWRGQSGPAAPPPPMPGSAAQRSVHVRRSCILRLVAAAAARLGQQGRGSAEEQGPSPPASNYSQEENSRGDSLAGSPERSTQRSPCSSQGRSCVTSQAHVGVVPQGKSTE